MDARMEELIHTDPLVWKAHAGRISEYDLILAMGNRHAELKKELMDLQAKCTCQINSIFINSTKKKEIIMTSEQRKQYSARLQTMSTEDKAQLFHESEQAAEASGGVFTSSDHAYSELFTNKQSGFYSEVTSNK